jgi:hypothetical protein
VVKVEIIATCREQQPPAHAGRLYVHALSEEARFKHRKPSLPADYCLQRTFNSIMARNQRIHHAHVARYSSASRHPVADESYTL